MLRTIGNVENELAAFAAKVLQLVSDGQPVKIYPGCGDTIAAGFLNIDVFKHKNLRDDDPRWRDRDIFIFPFADMAWPLPDSCADYIFHEDFFEHISQKQQICFLAETLRVLKPGAWHQVNTPCLVHSMKSNSNFARGFDGVYRAEWDKHGHVSLISRTILEEMAKLVGYREVVFTQKGQSVSKFRYPEGRPGPDRDQILGNVFADLLK